jgi:hypothetical protein
MKNDRARRNGVKRIATRAATIVGTWQPHQPLGQSVLLIGVVNKRLNADRSGPWRLGDKLAHLKLPAQPLTRY